MKHFVLIVVMLNCASAVFSQSLKKYDIGNSGAAVYLFCQSQFEKSLSEDSSRVYTSECDNDGVRYGVICVRLAQPIVEYDDAERVLISYLDYLKATFKITSSAGYGLGHRLKGREDTRGVLDYWKDEQKRNWKVKGWTDGNFIAVLYASSPVELPESKVNLFLDGFRLPGM